MRINAEFGAQLLNAIDEVESPGPPIAGLASAVNTLSNRLERYPDRLGTNMFGELTREAFGADRAGGLAQIFQQVSSSANLILHITACRTSIILEGIIAGLNNSRYLEVSLLTRALLEHAAIAQERQRRLVKLLPAFATIAPSNIRRAIKQGASTGPMLQATFAVIEELNLWYSAARFNFGAVQDEPDFHIELSKNSKLRQIGVNDAIAALEWSGPLLPATTPGFYYSLLCDYVHPNCGASWLYVDTQEKARIRHASSERETYFYSFVTAKTPSDMSLLLHVVSVIYIPLRESLHCYSAHLDWLSDFATSRRLFMQKLSDTGFKPIIGSDAFDVNEA